MNEVIKKFNETANETAYDIGKLLISLSTGIIVLSVSLQNSFISTKISYRYFLYSGWILEIISIILGTLFLFSMLRTYDIWDEIKTYYKPAIILAVLQYTSFIFGLIFLSLFTGLNINSTMLN